MDETPETLSGQADCVPERTYDPEWTLLGTFLDCGSWQLSEDVCYLRKLRDGHFSWQNSVSSVCFVHPWVRRTIKRCWASQTTGRPPYWCYQVTTWVFISSQLKRSAACFSSHILELSKAQSPSGFCFPRFSMKQGKRTWPNTSKYFQLTGPPALPCRVPVYLVWVELRVQGSR